MATATELKNVLDTNDAGVARLLTALGSLNLLGRDATLDEVVTQMHELARLHIVYPVEKAVRQAGIAAEVAW